MPQDRGALGLGLFPSLSDVIGASPHLTQQGVGYTPQGNRGEIAQQLQGEEREAMRRQLQAQLQALDYFGTRPEATQGLGSPVPGGFLPSVQANQQRRRQAYTQPNIVESILHNLTPGIQNTNEARVSALKERTNYDPMAGRPALGALGTYPPNPPGAVPSVTDWPEMGALWLQDRLTGSR